MLSPLIWDYYAKGRNDYDHIEPFREDLFYAAKNSKIFGESAIEKIAEQHQLNVLAKLPGGMLLGLLPPGYRYTKA